MVEVVHLTDPGEIAAAVHQGVFGKETAIQRLIELGRTRRQAKVMMDCAEQLLKPIKISN